jgi:hypothetical protein
VYDHLKKGAAAHRRSINSEVIVCLERTFSSRPLDPDAFLDRVDALREKVALPPLTEDAFRIAKASGRP